MKKNIYSIYKWLFAIPFIFCLTMTISVIINIGGALFGQGFSHPVAVIWSRLCCAVVPLKINLTGKSNFDQKTTYVVVANHQSMADIPLIHGNLGLHIKWIMKKELETVPIFGAACKNLGCISVDRSNREAALASIQKAKKKLSKKACVCFFPEGTRSHDGVLKPFKKGAFMFALEAGFPILPVTIKNSKKALPSGSLDLRPATIELIIHPPVPLDGFSTNNIDDLIAQIRATIATAL